mmetsp:Transcript_27837/g.83157  ORF Transcript_27837/g.83157 Transcript_27837/m.83157 type:complete len:517 (-) Transcript_27837:106-1656(-)
MSKSGSDSDSSDNSRDYAPAPRRENLPDAVDHFLGQLLDGLKKRNIPQIHTLYEDTFNKLTDKHYKTNRWPHVDRVKDEVSSEPLFLILYQELYYRHVFSRLAPTFDDRRRAWENYCKLLDLIIDDLDSGEDLTVALPPQWVWDLLDEFIYHYQTYCNFRNKAAKKQSEKEIQEIRENPEVFGTPKVLNYLHQLIKTSKIKQYLEDIDNAKGSTGGAFTDETTRLFGYFGLMQLLRMHSLLADYHLAMQTIETIDFDAEVPLFYKIPACHVTLYYYMGFAYLMLRRYVDAIKTFGDILVFLSKTSGVNSLSYQYDQMVKKQDQMYALLLVCLALCPRAVDESLEKTMRDKHGEKQGRLQRGEELCFEELFSYACPKFISAALPDFDKAENFNPNEAHQRQLHLFLQEVKEQQFLPRIGSYMKLYTAIKTSKLAQLCEMDEEGVRDQLMCVMHKTQQRVRQKGSPLEGVAQVCSEVEFYLDGDMVHINAQRVERPHSEVFLEQILKFQDLLRKMGKA